MNEASILAGRSSAPVEQAIPSSLRLYDVPQVARLLQITPQAVRKLIYQGQLEARRVGILVRIPQEAIVRFLEASPWTAPDARRDPRRRTAVETTDRASTRTPLARPKKGEPTTGKRASGSATARVAARPSAGARS